MAKMKTKKRIEFVLSVFLIGILICAQFAWAGTAFFTSSTGNSFSSSSVQYTQPSFTSYYSSSQMNTYWPEISDPENCYARQDFIVQIAPGGCEPAVVRSDLLEEQNVPVFCQLDTIKLNPLIDVEAIDTISFQGRYPDGVAGVSYHPARAALRTYDELLGSPILNNIGYVVILLKGGMTEDEMSDSIHGNLTAHLRYDLENSMGIGRAQFYLPILTDDEWESRYKEFSFWDGKGYVRLTSLSEDEARIVIYSDYNNIATSVSLEKGESSDKLYLPGFYCTAGLNVAFDSAVVPEEKAIIYVDDNRYEVYQGTKFFNDKCTVVDIDVQKEGDEIQEREVEISCSGTRFELELKPGTGLDNNYGNTQFGGYFDSAIENYEDVWQKYDAEKEEDTDTETLGEKALDGAIDLAADTGQQETLLYLLTEKASRYPDSVADQELLELAELDTSEASGTLVLDGETHYLRLISVSEADKSENHVKIEVVGKKEVTEYQKDETIYGSSGSDEYFVLKDYDEDKAEVYYSCKEDGDRETGTVDIFEGRSDNLCGHEIYVKDIKYTAVAKVRLIPQTDNVQTQANFSFNIGIEERAIDLSPEKTKEMITNIEDNIDKWQSINEKLGNTVEALKGTCLAVSAFLTVKNFFNNLGGKATARTIAMRGTDGDGGWTKQCKTEIEAGEHGGSYDACYLANEDEINADVTAIAKQLAEQNEKLTELDNANTEESVPFLSFFESKTVNVDGFNEDYFTDTYRSQVKTDITGLNLDDIEINGVKTQASAVADLLTKDNLDKGYFAQSEAIAIEQYSQLLSTGGLSSVTEQEVKGKLTELLTKVQKAESQGSAAETLSGQILTDFGMSGAEVSVLEGKDSKKGEYTGEIASPQLKTKLGISGTDQEPVQFVNLGSNYIIHLEQSGEGSNTYTKKAIYKYDGTKVWDKEQGHLIEDEEVKDLVRQYSSFIKYDAQLYDNPFKQKASDLEIRFFETEPYKEMPEFVPFDLDGGWYVKTQQTLPGFEQTQTFLDSGAPSSFWLCNVGSDGEEDSIENDMCHKFNVNTGAPTDVFHGLSNDEAEDRVEAATTALKQAARQYASKGTGITISTKYGTYTFKQGDAAVDIPATQCQDFMSPTDCWTMFNVCDPVICPTSRCDMGGKYQVDNVIQQGIVGSIFLCLPNAREKIFVPVCLSGIHAGIDSYVSILEAGRDCLQESLDTGQNVGICDEITSIYKCEFFWRQIAPAVNVILPKLFEKAQGQGTRGGGEYLTVSDAWDNAEASLDYMTQTYAVNSIEAYNIRSTEEAGTEICEGFISTRYPTSFETLIEPDSPTQFMAWYDEIPYSDVTVPPTSQYKVYYHIFAGNDQGAYYTVFLKNPPESTEYSQTQTVVVDTGYAPVGEYIDETKDFTAPSGYQELCVRINNQEECGFGKVSTSFALNYANDLYVQEQALNQNVQTEQECVSGTATMSSLGILQPNIQSAAEQALMPEIYKQGITRVCATNNPGTGTEPERWVEMGNCGSDSIKCWLDINSVKTAIMSENNATWTSTVEELEALADAAEQTNLVTSDALDGYYKDIDTQINSISSQANVDDVTSVLNEINQKIDGMSFDELWNNQKAKLTIRKARAYDQAARRVFELMNLGNEGTADDSGGGSSGGTTRGSSSGGSIEYDSNQYNENTLGFVGEADYFDKVKEVSEKRDINYNLIRAIIAQESSWDQGKINGDSIGIMQLTKDGAVAALLEKECKDDDICDNEEYGLTYTSFVDDSDVNIEAGVCYLKCIKEYYKITDMELMIATYNGGPPTIKSKCVNADKTFDECKSELETETQEYVPKVLEYYNSYSSS